jgi:hypothetical protein
MYTHSIFMYMLGIAWETTRASRLKTLVVTLWQCERANHVELRGQLR